MIKAGPRWGYNWFINYDYSTNGRPIITTNDYKMVFYITFNEYDGDLC